MDRRNFIRNVSIAGGAMAISGNAAFTTMAADGESLPLQQMRQMQSDEPWFNKAMRWAQVAFVENDPEKYDRQFWVDYFKKAHIDGVLLSAGGIVANYPTQIPLHHRSDWLGDKDILGDLIAECRKMEMTVVLRTDPHAVRQDVCDAHPEYIAVTADGQKRRHWARTDLWVTCALGPYNFEFMTEVHKEIMQRYMPEGIFSNRWAGHGVCYCDSCKKLFKAATGLNLPKNTNRLDPVYQKWNDWQTDRLKELWFLWDAEIRKIKPTARFIPNGFPDRMLTGKYSDFFFADQQGRRGQSLPWENARGAKELRASLGLKPLIGIFSVGLEEEFRWKDSVQTDAELRIWVAEGTANGMKPCFVKFGAHVLDTRWMDTIAAVYQNYYKSERYLRNTASMSRIGVVFSQQTSRRYGGESWQQNSNQHGMGMYHALVEGSIPFDMVNDQMMDTEGLKQYKLLILPNIAALSDAQCDQLRAFVGAGGSIVATYETSLYDENGKRRADFGLKDLIGASFDNAVEGPMRNSYLKLKKDASGAFHPALQGLENAYRIINTIYNVKVKPLDQSLPSPVTLVPTYPDLPMEDVYPRIEETDIRELYLRQVGKGRVAYFPVDIDRTFWQLMADDHARLLRSTIDWALNEDPVVDVKCQGVMDVAVWRQKDSMTVHLVNLTNPMMMKGPFRDIFPVDATVDIQIPDNSSVKAVKLLFCGKTPQYSIRGNRVSLYVPQVPDHEIVAIDLT
ncbi:MAG: beta-galactosidase trimerization domain-containing protein [Tannerella sp.]|nr:beta-galactosidase trimerization domain-containing protein [Tannerella sp.]